MQAENLLPTAEPESSHSIASPTPGAGLCPQGWTPQQTLRSVDISPQIPENLVYPPKPGTQYVIIEATWEPTSVSSSMEKLVLVAPHAGYIFIQTDKTIYTPEQSGTAPPGALGLGQVLTLIPFPLVGPKFHLPRRPSVQGSPPPLPKILVTIPTSSPNPSPGSESSLLLQFNTGCTP